MQRVLLFLLTAFLFSFASAQEEVAKDMNEFASRSKGKQKWSRSVDWYNLDNPIDFHNPRHNTFRLIHFFDPSNPACVSIARHLEERFEHSKQIQTIHVACPPRGIIADSAYVTQILLQHELREPVAVFTDVDPVEYLEITQFPSVVFTHSGGVIAMDFSGHDGVLKGLDEIEELATSDKLGQIPVFEPKPKNVYADLVPRKLIASPTYMVGVDRESRIYVSDYQRNRILLVDIDGQINERIGDGARGFQDGSIHRARFDGPSGLAYDRKSQTLYIADTHNHAIRAVDLRTRSVSTVLGTGTPAIIAPEEVYGTTAAISSPTDLLLGKGKLYIAMTGFNQVWELDLLTQKAKPIAGSGQRGSDDSQEDPLQASFSGPQALSFGTDGDLIVVDNYTGNVRQIKDGQVNTILKNDSSEIKLKSPTDIIRKGGDFWIADPLAHQVFKMTPKGELSVVNGTGDCGYQDGKATVATHGAVTGLLEFNETVYASDALYGIIRTLNGKKAKMDTFEFSSVDGLLAFEGAISEGMPWYFDELKMAEGTNTINFSVNLDENYVIRSNARNEIALADGKAETRKMREDGWYGGKAVFEVDNTMANRYIQFELYMTFSPKEKPEMIYYASVGVIIPFHEEYISQSTHDVELKFFDQFNRNLLP